MQEKKEFSLILFLFLSVFLDEDDLSGTQSQRVG